MQPMTTALQPAGGDKTIAGLYTQGAFGSNGGQTKTTACNKSQTHTSCQALPADRTAASCCSYLLKTDEGPRRSGLLPPLQGPSHMHMKEPANRAAWR